MNFLRKASRGSLPTFHYKRAESQPTITVPGEDPLEVDPEYAAYEDQVCMEEESSSVNSDSSFSSSEGVSRQNLKEYMHKSKAVLSSATVKAVKGLRASVIRGASKTKLLAQNLRNSRQKSSQAELHALADGIEDGEEGEEDEEEVIVEVSGRSGVQRQQQGAERKVFPFPIPASEELLPQDEEFLSLM